MENSTYFYLFQIIDSYCQVFSNSNVTYKVLQFSNDCSDASFILKLANFYNNNWVGNRDFMHIPNIDQLMEDIHKYPIIVATDEHNNILGATIIRLEKNDDFHLDPYIPYQNTNILTVNAILTNKNNLYKGIGKNLYKIALFSAAYYKQLCSNLKMFCVVDCRNYNSLYAATCAAKGTNYKVNIDGFYEVIDFQTGQLLESPTLVVEFDLNQTQSMELASNILLKYDNTNFNEHKKVLMQNLIQEPYIEYVQNIDSTVGFVNYYELSKKIHASDVLIVPGNSCLNNDRVPSSIHYFNNSGEYIVDLLDYIRERMDISCLVRR